jgi:hypothetical protein
MLCNSLRDRKTSNAENANANTNSEAPESMASLLIEARDKHR